VGTPDYIRVLGALLRKHNHAHSVRDKRVSTKTMIDRERFLVSFFRELRRDTRFRNLDPRQLANRHIQLIVRRWVQRHLATATIHNYLSFLRSYAGWIGKPGMVQEPEYYVGATSEHAHRSQVATHDHSWTARDVDIAAKIAEVSAIDVWVGLQLELCAEFGLRGKEARHFRPHEAIIPREAANPRDAEAFPECETFVRISRGTKGGRLRDVPLVTESQHALLLRLTTMVAPGRFVGHPALTSVQAQARFYYVIRQCGISKKELGVVAHGLRHQHVNDVFERDSGVPSPVRGSGARAPADEAARQRASRILGHNRLQVTSCYLGSVATHLRSARAANGSSSDPAEANGSVTDAGETTL
jgi:integrase